MVRAGRARLCGIAEINELSVGGEVSRPMPRGALGESLVVIARQFWRRRPGRIRSDTDPAAGANLPPKVGQFASLLKCRVSGADQGAVTVGNQNFYLDEFTFRFNCRTSGPRGLWFQRLRQQAVAIAPVHGRTIRGDRPFPIPAPPKWKGKKMHAQTGTTQ